MGWSMVVRDDGSWAAMGFGEKAIRMVQQLGQSGAAVDSLWWHTTKDGQRMGSYEEATKMIQATDEWQQ